MKASCNLSASSATLWLAAGAATLLAVQPARAADQQVTFTQITDGPIATDALRSWGCALVDYDNDGFTDIFVATAFGGTSCLYHNDGRFQFSKVTSEPVVMVNGDSCTGVYADYDNDGDSDLFVSNFDPYRSCFFRNDLGAGNSTVFTRITSGPWVDTVGQSVGAAWADYDNDGFVDLFVANTSDQNEFLYRNDRAGGMTRITNGPLVRSGGASQNCAWADYDNDGLLDLFVANSFGQTNFLFHNADEGTFSRVTDAPPVTEAGTWIGPAWADYDNDGHMDLFVANGGRQNDALYHNNGDGTFTPIVDDPVVTSGGASEGGAWGDFDNDGYLDLFVSNNWGEPDFLFHNERDGTFSQIYEGEVVNDTSNGLGCAWADFDNDGFLDLFVSNGPEDPAAPGEHNFLYRNDAKANGNTNGWLLVRLIGTASNRSAIGANFRVRATIWGKEVRQMREISGGSGQCSQNDLRVHFGLGDAAHVDLLRIEWPSGTVQELKNVTAKQILTITEPVQLMPLGPTEFQIRCWKGMQFEVEMSHNLQAWDSLGMATNVTGTLTFQDTQGDPGTACCLYRVVSR
jgi:hypothetical protein